MSTSRVRFLRDLPKEHQIISNDFLHKTGEVVYIMEKKHIRVAVGVLKHLSTESKKWILLSPFDFRIPRIIIPRDQAPDDFFTRPQDFTKFSYVANILDWPASSYYAPGRLVCSLGQVGNIESEMKGLLMANGIDTSEFPESVLSSLNIDEKAEWKVPTEELKCRRDFRNEVVFTIDPVTAKDLDDALHIKPIMNCDGAGTSGWEVGVHIADVSYFVKLGTELDTTAAKRGTSVYLFDKVIPMLPNVLSEKLCSLISGTDRLAMSVVWKIDDDANVYDEWVGRSVIHNCCQLSYDLVQEMIENPKSEIDKVRFPEIFNSKTFEEIRMSVLQLNKLAKLLHENRVRNGSLEILQPKLCFTLNENCMPCGVSVEERNEANSLVEEFVLLANIAVARRIFKAFPKKALLRRHPPPNLRILQNAIDKFEATGFYVDGSTSKSIALSLAKFAQYSNSKINLSQIISHFLLKSMKLAVYFCAGAKANISEYRHYALSVSLYTHFTSPIRRYSDIMVHRFLAAALGYEGDPELDVKEINAIASHCNDTALAAKTVSDASIELFFGLFLKECGPLIESAVVVRVLDASFDVFILKFGFVKRVYINEIKFPKPYVYNESDKVPYLSLYWQQEASSGIFEQKVEFFSILDVILSAEEESLKFKVSVMKPNEPKNKDIKLQDILKESSTQI
uniref:RNB domain-containing protein n=1 Tax=Syphacia muris TaxID=451379 RepID=A0A0N5AWI3_9BILA